MKLSKNASDVLRCHFCLRRKDVQCTVVEDGRNHKIFTYKKLKKYENPLTNTDCEKY